jgi:[acyl-carrier-protein] S-malonyltransferase
MSAGLDLQWTQDEPLIRLAENGPDDALRQTANAQKAVFAVTASLWEKSGLDRPAVTMGHSLGEYMALAVSGSISVRECYGLVSARAQAMQDAMPPGTGTMAAVLGMTASDVARWIEPVENVWVANINTQDQVVISGDASSVKDAASLLRQNGARKVVPLNVSMASHCPHMEPAGKVLRERLKGTEIKRPGAPVVFNVTAREESDPERVKDLLALQLVSPVHWEGSVRYVLGLGVDRFIEIGPKSVLASLVKRIAPEAQVEVITAREH